MQLRFVTSESAFDYFRTTRAYLEQRRSVSRPMVPSRRISRRFVERADLLQQDETRSALEKDGDAGRGGLAAGRHWRGDDGR
jgi:hypothetical protein